MSEDHEAAVAIQKREATEGQIQKINKLHDECCDDRALKDAILTKVNKGRECGLELIAFGRANKGGFKGMFRAPGKTSFTFPFTFATASIYMRFARANPEPITDIADGISCLKDALIASGALAAPSGHGSQALHTFDFIGALQKQVFSLKELWGAHTKKEPLSEDQKAIALETLEWPARRFVELGGRL